MSGKSPAALRRLSFPTSPSPATTAPLLLPPQQTLMMLTPPHYTDIDGDSTMHSSPDLAAADDEMFPDEAPSTPKNAAAFALDPASELSPPNSQGGPSTSTAASAILNANGKRILPPSASGEASSSSVSGGVHTDPATGYQWSKHEDQPGYEWKNNRAREEEARALEQIVDKANQIKRKLRLCAAGCVWGQCLCCDTGRYGDPLKADVPMTLGR